MRHAGVMVAKIMKAFQSDTERILNSALVAVAPRADSVRADRTHFINFYVAGATGTGTVTVTETETELATTATV